MFAVGTVAAACQRAQERTAACETRSCIKMRSQDSGHKFIARAITFQLHSKSSSNLNRCMQEEKRDRTLLPKSQPSKEGGGDIIIKQIV